MACSERTTSHYDENAKVFYGKEYETLRIPTSMWDSIQAVYHPTEKKKEKSENEGVEGPASANVPTVFYPIHVHLREKTPGVLGGTNHRFEYPEGGGLLDLSHIVQSKVRGTFFVAVEPRDLDEENGTMRVFYLSAGRQRKIGDVVVGSGCHQYMDITSYFHKVMKKEGFRANTSDQRYVSLLAGSYFFVLAKQEELYVAQLTITDSRFPDLVCDLEAGNKNLSEKP